MRTVKTLIRLGGCPGWSESSLGALSLCWFCRAMALFLAAFCLSVQKAEHLMKIVHCVSGSKSWFYWRFMLFATANESHHDKTNKMSVRPAKTLISLRICPVWSESSQCAQWVAKDPRFLHADSEDWSDWADAQADLSLRWTHSHFVGFVMSRIKSKGLKSVMLKFGVWWILLVL